MATLDAKNQLTTLDRASEYLGESTGSTGLDGRIVAAINAASLRANSLTGRQLKQRSHDEVYDGDGSRRLMLNQYPVVSSSSTLQLYITSTRDDFSSSTDFDTQVDWEDINVNTEKGELFIKDQSFTLGNENVRVVYTAGYDTTSAATTTANHIPGDLQDAVHELLAFQWEKQRRRAWVTRTISHDDGSMSYFDTIPMTAMSVIEEYRDWRQ